MLRRFRSRSLRVLDRYEGSDNLDRSSRILNEPRLLRDARGSGLSVVVLSLDSPELIIPLIERLGEARDLFTERGLGFEILIGDSGSTDPGVLACYDTAPDYVTILRHLPYHFSRSNNDCLERSRFDHLLLLNNDVILPSGAPLMAMYQVLTADHAVGAVGLALDYPNGTIQHFGVDVLRVGAWQGFPFHPGAGDPARHRPGTCFEAVAVTGACLMTPVSVWNAAGGLDESYERECQDIDLCLNIRRLGHTVKVVDAGPVVHIENASRPPGDEHWPDRVLFTRRWRSFVQAEIL